MLPPDRDRFGKFLTSEAASRDAQNNSKNAVFFCLASALFVLIFRPWDFGLWWLLILPAVAFAGSILLAVPIWLARMSVAWANWYQPSRARMATFLIDLIGLAAYVLGTYFALRALWFWTI